MTIRKIMDAAVAAMKLLPYPANKGCGVDMVFCEQTQRMLVQLTVAGEMLIMASVTIQTECEEPLLTDGDTRTELESDDIPGVKYTTYDDLFDGLVDDEDFNNEDTVVFHMYLEDWRQAFRGDVVTEYPGVYSLDRANNEEGGANCEEDIVEDPKCAACVAAVKGVLEFL